MLQRAAFRAFEHAILQKSPYSILKRIMPIRSTFTINTPILAKFYCNRRNVCTKKPDLNRANSKTADSPEPSWAAAKPDQQSSIEEFYPKDSLKYDFLLPTPVSEQLALVNQDPGNRHLRFDLVTLSLRYVKQLDPLDWKGMSILLRLCEHSMGILNESTKFVQQLQLHLTKHMTDFQKLDIRNQTNEIKQKCMKSNWQYVPLMATYAHYLLLAADNTQASLVISKALKVSLAEYYFFQGKSYEFAAPLSPSQGTNGTEQNDEGIAPDSPLFKASVSYCRAIFHHPIHSASYTNLATLEYYRHVDTETAFKTVQAEMDLMIIRPKGYNPPTKKSNNIYRRHPSDGNEYNHKVAARRAIKLLEKAIETDSSNTNYVAHYHLAFILESAMDDTPRAKTHYGRAIEINPDYYQAHTALGSILLDEKFLDEAVQHYQQARLLAPDQPLVYYNLANALGRQGYIEAASNEMHFIIRKLPTLPDPHYHLGNIFSRAGKYEEGIICFEAAVELASKHPEHPFDVAPALNRLQLLYRQVIKLKMDQQDITVDDYDLCAMYMTKCIDVAKYEPSQRCSDLLQLSFLFMFANRPQAALEVLNDAFKDELSIWIEEQRPQLDEEQQQNYIDELTAIETQLDSLEDTRRNIALGNIESTVVTEVSSSPKKQSKKSTKVRKTNTTETSKRLTYSGGDKSEIPAPLDTPAIQVETKAEQMSGLPRSLPEISLEQLLVVDELQANLLYKRAVVMWYLGEFEITHQLLKEAVALCPDCTITEEPVPDLDDERQLDPKQRYDATALKELEEFGASIGTSRKSLQLKEQNDHEIEDLDLPQDDLELPELPKLNHIPLNVKLPSALKKFTAEAQVARIADFVKPQADGTISPGAAKVKEFFESVIQQYGSKSDELLDKLISDGRASSDKRPIRKARTKRRKDAKYSLERSKALSKQGPDHIDII